jgi:protein-disulfide isomerase
MKKLLLSALMLTVAACQPDTKNLERKLDDQTKAIAALSAKVDRIQGGGGGAAAGAAQAQARAQRAEPDRAKTYAVPVEGDPFDGPPDAKVTLIKAYDYACPYCERVRDTMDQLRQKYGNDLRIVYKTLVVHPRNATAAALAFCAANRQGKGKEMDHTIWEKGFKARNLDNSDVAAPAEANGQQAPGGGGGKCWDSANGCPIAVGWAQELGLNIDQFKADMKGDCQGIIQSDMRALQGLGVAATPSFFINGRFLSGAMPIENFSALIDEELKKANERIQAGTPAAQYYRQWVLEKGQKQLDKQ